MRYERIHLKDSFPFLGEEGCDPTVELYLPYNMKEMGREKQKRPCLIVCPGGGYEMCSEREAEPIALHFLPEGFNVFVLTYSVAPHRFPTQLLEVAALMELIYAHEEEWNCDRTKVGIMGFSAGGHLALLFAYKKIDTSPIKPVAAVAYAPPTDLYSSEMYISSRLGSSKKMADRISLPTPQRQRRKR